MVVLTFYYPDGSITITNTSIFARWKYSYYKHEYITQMEVLTLQTRVYYPDASIQITNTIWVIYSCL